MAGAFCGNPYCEQHCGEESARVAVSEEKAKEIEELIKAMTEVSPSP